MRNHSHVVTGALRTHRQAARVNLGAANVPRQVLMCQVQDLQTAWAIGRLLKHKQSNLLSGKYLLKQTGR